MRCLRPVRRLLAGAVFAGAAVRLAPARGMRAAGLALAIALVAASGFGSRMPFEPASSKHLSMLFDSKKMAPVLHRWTALFRTDLVRATEATEFTRADTWGISPNARPDTIQSPWGYVVHDGTAGTPLYDLRKGRLEYFDEHVLSLPYWVANPHPRVLVIGVGGGRDVVAAVRYGASSVTGVELDPVTLDLIRDELADVHAGFFSRDDVVLIAGEGRHFVKSTRDRFDVIQLTGVDTLAATASGAYVLAENYLYTVEAFHDFLDRLRPGGVLSFGIGNWSPTAPQAAGRILDVARAALLERGVADPSRHVALVDSSFLFTELLVRNEAVRACRVPAHRRRRAQARIPAVARGRRGHAALPDADRTGRRRARGAARESPLRHPRHSRRSPLLLSLQPLARPDPGA